MAYPFEHYRFEVTPKTNVNDGVYSVRQKVLAQCVDMVDDAIVQAVVDVAREEGISDLYLLDKTFVVNALTKAIKEYNEGRCQQ